MTKHYIIKTHGSHKAFIYIISAIMLLMGFLLAKNLSNFNVTDEVFKTYTVVLLFVLTVILIILVLIVSWFIIEIKDKVLETEEEEEEILKRVKKKG
ncbi:hypothetical protein JXA85_08190 [Candidatus Woesearchaeota archaeon]|nr:hypothetical protein [Candidatus Woesearchaeota archaeon]